jgi:hypothetical protein
MSATNPDLEKSAGKSHPQESVDWREKLDLLSMIIGKHGLIAENMFYFL